MARYYVIASIAIFACLVMPSNRANGIPAKPLYEPSENPLDDEGHILIERRFTMDCQTTWSGLMNVPAEVDVIGRTREPDGVERARIVVQRVLLIRSEFLQNREEHVYPDIATIGATHRQIFELERIQNIGGSLYWELSPPVRSQERIRGAALLNR